MIRVLLMLSLLIIVSCENNELGSIGSKLLEDTAKILTPKPQNIPLHDSILTTDSLYIFKTYFLDRFSSDSLFQIKYAVFPLLEKGYERNVKTDEDVYFEKKLELKDWRHMDLRYDSSVYYREYGRYTQNFEMIGNDTIKINYRGIDNGIFFGYTFAKDTTWKLVSFWEFSN